VIVLFSRCARTGIPANGCPLEEVTLPLSSESSAAKDLPGDKKEETLANVTSRTAAWAYMRTSSLVNIVILLVR